MSLSATQAAEVADLRARLGRVVVLMGGDAAEREVSLRSGDAVLRALLSLGFDACGFDWRRERLGELLALKPARVFVALHGRGGEDGAIQGALESAGIDYTGSGVLGCALSMDKIRAKRVWTSLGLPTPPFVVATAGMSEAAIVAEIGLPLIVKPAHEGSSIGVTPVSREAELGPALALARRHDRDVLVEALIRGGEYTLPIVDGIALPAIRLETPRVFYDYEAKYHADSTRYHCPAGLTDAEEAELARLALAACAALEVAGWARIDFMLDTAGRPYLIELNAVPGMTDHSLVPLAARVAGWSFEYLVFRILAASGGGAT